MGIEFTKDARDKKPGYDPLAVDNKKDGFRYRWIRKDRMNLDKRRWEGWETVQGSGERSTLQAEAGEMRKPGEVDTTVNIGDLVLARMPEDRFQERLARPNRERISHMTGSVGSSFRSAVARVTGEDLAYEEHKDNKNMKTSDPKEK